MKKYRVLNWVVASVLLSAGACLVAKEICYNDIDPCYEEKTDPTTPEQNCPPTSTTWFAGSCGQDNIDNTGKLKCINPLEEREVEFKTYSKRQTLEGVYFCLLLSETKYKVWIRCPKFRECNPPPAE